MGKVAILAVLLCGGLPGPGPAHAEAQDSSMALLVAVCGRGGEGKGRTTEDAEFFQSLLPSFLVTTAPGDGFDYTFYVAFDVGDPFYDSPERRAEFERIFLSHVDQRPLDQKILGAVLGSSALRTRAKLRWVDVGPYEDGQSGPVRAWNVAFQEAFSDGAEYFYQLGEDVRLATPGWASKLVGQLRKQGDVGIAGGREMHFQATSNELLPNVLVPRAHMHIFGTFFPTRFHNWWSDNWIFQAYKPFNLVVQDTTVKIVNGQANKRYNPTYADKEVQEEFQESSHREISEYLKLLGPSLISPEPLAVAGTFLLKSLPEKKMMRRESQSSQGKVITSHGHFSAARGLTQDGNGDGQPGAAFAAADNLP